MSGRNAVLTPSVDPAESGQAPAGARAPAPPSPVHRRAEPAPPAPPGVRIAAARTIVHRLLRRWKGSRLILADAAGRSGFGPHDGAVRRVHVRHPGTYEMLLRRGGRGLGRAYVDGWWTTDDLAGLLGDAYASSATLTGVANVVPERLRRALAPVARPGDPDRDRSNVRAHYDLSNDFFALFLDETMTYSCALFGTPHDTLETAQRNKLELVCRRLGLGPDDHVVEIGTGWGSFAIHAAGQHGCRVTTTTVSADQYALARRRVRDAGLGELVTVLDVDYRDLDGTYDAAVSIEMIEAVGWRDHQTFLSTCSRLLRPGGRLGLQAILIDDAHYERAKHTRDFIKEYVFPGGCLPSRARIAEVAASTDLAITGVDDLSPHYDRTLQCWADRLAAHRHRLADVGADDRLRRLWEFYLAYCQAGFRTGHIGVAQFTMVGPG